jgi:CBS domain-containing protein
VAKIDKHFTRDIVGLATTATCREAARIMSERQIGAVAVRDGDRIIGLVTERDLVARLLARDGTIELPIQKVMRRDLPRVAPGASELECAALMRQHYTRHLLVGDKDSVVGIISMRDVIALMLDEKQYVIEQLRSYVYQT